MLFLLLAAIGPDSLTTPESIVGWLLEHPEVAASDTDSLSSLCDSDTESVSYDNASNAVQPFGPFVSRHSEVMFQFFLFF